MSLAPPLATVESFAVDECGVTFRSKDRSDHNRSKVMTLTGSEFVRRYLRHVLPSGLRSIRYYGFCHPAAKAKRQRIQIHTRMPFELNSRPSPDAAPPGAAPWPRCPTCDSPMRLTGFDPATLQDLGPTTRPSCP